MARIQGIQARLPVAGRIRLGTKDEARGFPRASSHFIVPDEVRAALQDEKPTRLEIIFPSDDEDYVARSSYEYYQQSLGYICTGDGEVADRQSDTSVPLLQDGTPMPVNARTPKESIQRLKIRCAGKDCPLAKEKKCKPVLHLSFLLPGVTSSFGVYVLNTSSFKSITNVYSALDFTRHLAGRIDGIPFYLSLVPEQAKNPQTQRMQTVYRLELRPVQGQGELVSLRRKEGLPAGKVTLSLPEPTDDEQAFLEAEFTEVADGDALADVADEQRKKSHLLDEALNAGGELVSYELNKPVTTEDVLFRQRIGVSINKGVEDALAHLAVQETGTYDQILVAKLAKTDLPGVEQLFPYVKRLPGDKTGFDPAKFWEEAGKLISDKNEVFSLIQTDVITDWLRQDRKRSLRGLLAALRDIRAMTEQHAAVA